MAVRRRLPTLLLPLALLAAGTPVPVLAVGALVGGAGLMLGNSVWESTLQRHVPTASLSRVSAYDWFGSIAFKPVGLAVAGPIAAAAGLSPALWLAFALMLVTELSLLTVPAIRATFQLPPPPAEPYAAARILTPPGPTGP